MPSWPSTMSLRRTSSSKLPSESMVRASGSTAASRTSPPTGRPIRGPVGAEAQLQCGLAPGRNDAAPAAECSDRQRTVTSEAEVIGPTIIPRRAGQGDRSSIASPASGSESLRTPAAMSASCLASWEMV